MVTADDVAGLALFLCSPAARNLTGQAISVDGEHGMSLSAEPPGHLRRAASAAVRIAAGIASNTLDQETRWKAMAMPAARKVVTVGRPKSCGSEGSN